MRKIIKQIIFTAPPIMILISFYLLRYPVYIFLGFILGTYIFTLSERADKSERWKWRKPILWFSGRYIMLFLYLAMVYGGLLPFFIAVPKFRTIFKEYQHIIILGFVFYYMYSYMKFKRIKVSRYTVDNFHLEKECRIAFISDIHLDEFKSVEYLRKRVDMVNGLGVDHVLIGGDIFDSYESLVGFDYTAEFDRFDAPVYAIWGNHDYRGDIDISRKKLKEANIKVLEDERVIIENGFCLVGRKDARVKGRKKLAELLEGTELPVLLLDHQPLGLDKVAKNKNIKLQLSGHTHGGQIFPVTILYSFLYSINRGMRKVEGTSFIVSEGVGAAFTPFRFGTSNEIVHITLK